MERMCRAESEGGRRCERHSTPESRAADATRKRKKHAEKCVAEGKPVRKYTRRPSPIAAILTVDTQQTKAEAADLRARARAAIQPGDALSAAFSVSTLSRLMTMHPEDSLARRMDERGDDLEAAARQREKVEGIKERLGEAVRLLQLAERLEEAARQNHSAQP